MIDKIHNVHNARDHQEPPDDASVMLRTIGIFAFDNADHVLRSANKLVNAALCPKMNGNEEGSEGASKSNIVVSDYCINLYKYVYQ